jgi:spore coat protein A
MHEMTRRSLLRLGAGAGAAALVAPAPARGWAGTGRVTAPQLARFVQRLPVPGAGIVVAAPTHGRNHYAVVQRQISRKLHPALPPTPVWAYDDGSGLAGQSGSFGLVLVARSGTPTRVTFTNNLPPTYPAWLPVDTDLVPRGREVRLMTHLHGGFVGEDSDGNPAVRPQGFGRGETQSVLYPNQREQNPASLLWFHDHGLGATRLNVVAGLSAGYILRDDLDTGAEPNAIGLPGGAFEVPLVIQDRSFNTDGTFRYPVSDIPDTTWVGEYFGDVMVVNGKVWPFLDVEPRLYRFRVLNGCNARILRLSLAGPDVWQIGADGGMWDRPVRRDDIVLAPGERADVLVDFAGHANRRMVLRNDAPEEPVVTPAPALEQVMQFRVGSSVTRRGPRSVPTSLPGRRAELPKPARTRFITLNEIDVDESTWFLNLNGLHFGEGPVVEAPRLGTVEDWVYVNLTGDTHPLHTHLVSFQVVGRTPFDVSAYEERYEGVHGVPGGIDPTRFVTGPMRQPDPGERGFKDTVKVNPAELTRIRARFELPAGVSAPQRYVYHCHILEHEDNDMMRPFTVTP